jgi:hypothetical protein
MNREIGHRRWCDRVKSRSRRCLLVERRPPRPGGRGAAADLPTEIPRNDEAPAAATRQGAPVDAGTGYDKGPAWRPGPRGQPQATRPGAGRTALVVTRERTGRDRQAGVKACFACRGEVPGSGGARLINGLGRALRLTARARVRRRPGGPRPAPRVAVVMAVAVADMVGKVTAERYEQVVAEGRELVELASRCQWTLGEAALEIEPIRAPGGGTPRRARSSTACQESRCITCSPGCSATRSKRWATRCATAKDRTMRIRRGSVPDAADTLRCAAPPESWRFRRGRPSVCDRCRT